MMIHLSLDEMSENAGRNSFNKGFLDTELSAKEIVISANGDTTQEQEDLDLAYNSRRLC